MCGAREEENLESGAKICLSTKAIMYLVEESVVSGEEITLLAYPESFEAVRIR